MMMKIGWTVSVLVLCALAHASSARTVLVFGDSLSTAFGMDETQGWVHLLGERLEAEQPGTRIINASVNGETTKGGLKRLARGARATCTGRGDPGTRCQ